MALVEEFQNIVDLFEREGVDYAVCGGFAVTLLGAPRLTHDINFLILDSDAERVKALLLQRGYTLGKRFPFGVGTDKFREVERRTKVDDETITVDLLLVKDPNEDIWTDRAQLEGHGKKIWVVSKAALATMKRQAGRPKDLEDLRNLGIE